MIQGCDVSSYQGVIDWNLLRRHNRRVDFAMLRIAEWRTDKTDAGQLDTQFKNNLDGVCRNGIVPGVYNRANPVLNTAEQEATAFVSRLSYYDLFRSGVIYPVLDLEDTTQNWAAWLREFIAVYQDIAPTPELIIYSSGSFFEPHLGGEAGLPDNVKFWVAHTEQWGATPGNPKYKPARTVMHQYSHTGSLTGITGPVDLDVLMPGTRLKDIMQWYS